MTVEELARVQGFSAVILPEPEKEINGAYVGDLLSWVMGRAQAGNVWITIMSNINVAAVASLADTACVVLAEGVSLSKEDLAQAEAKNINIISTDMPAYEAAVAVSRVI